MNPPQRTRRDFLSEITFGAGLLLAGCHRLDQPQREGVDVDSRPPSGPADVTLRIGPVLADIAKDHTISTIGYNGTVPGPLIRLREGVPVTVDLFNETDMPEFVHWHGQIIPADVDGAEEEKSLVVPAHGHLRYRLMPQPAGTRWVHTHVMPMSDLTRGTYTGQFGLVFIEPKSNPGQYDQEFFLATHEWEPYFTTEEMDEEQSSEEREKTQRKPKDETPNGWEIGYQRFTINGKGYDGKAKPHQLHKGRRYRLVLDNQTDDAHPVHLHRNSFELTQVYGKPTSGILKDVVLVKGFKKIEADLVPAMEGLTLFHCHQQLHMDYGFKLLFNVV